MNEIRDINNKLLCKANYLTGDVEVKIKDLLITTKLNIGEDIGFENKCSKTILKRISDKEFEVKNLCIT